MNLVSIIVPYFKKRNYIKKCIRSVLKQDYTNFEIIIVYDDEDLRDVNLIKSIKKLDKRIIVIYNSKNKGAGFSRNLGIKYAQGDLIAFLDSDDVWKKDKLRLQIEFMNKTNADFSFTSYEIINSIGIKQNKKREAESILNYKSLIRSCDIGLSTVMVKKSLFNNYYKFPNLKTKEDYVLWLKFAKKKIILHGLNLVLAQWRITDNSLSSNASQKIFDAFLVYYKYMKFNFFKSCASVFFLSLNYIKKKYL